MRAALVSMLILLLVTPALAATSDMNQGSSEMVKNPEESGRANIRIDEPKATTTGTDVEGRGYVCRTLLLRREDGGVSKVRKCAAE
jgi:hypothetical protein